MGNSKGKALWTPALPIEFLKRKASNGPSNKVIGKLNFILSILNN